MELTGNVVVVGENRVGKSNLLYALRLLFDPALPDSARQLSLSDFWDGLETPSVDDKIIVSVEIREFEDDLDVLALLTDHRLDSDPDTVRTHMNFVRGRSWRVSRRRTTTLNSSATAAKVKRSILAMI